MAPCIAQENSKLPPAKDKAQLLDKGDETIDASVETAAIEQKVNKVLSGPPPKTDVFANVSKDTMRTLTLLQAAAITVQNQFDIQLAYEEFYFNEGVWQESAGPFDPLLSFDENIILKDNAQNLGIPMKSRCKGFDKRFIASASKKTRLGTIYSLDYTREDSYDPSLSPFRRIVPHSFAFTINQPILRGFYSGSDTMFERASYMEVQAAYYDALQVTSQRIYDTAVAYWEMVAARKIRNVIFDSVQRFINLLENTQKLVQQDQLAKADLVQPLAQLASQKIDLQFAEQEYYRTYEELKFAMNVVEETPCILEELFITDDFPDVEFQEGEFQNIRCFLLEKARKGRYDIIANQKRLAAADFLVLGAYNDTLPELNVVGGVARRNYSASSRVALGGSSRGPAENDWSIGLNFSMPLYNDKAKGILKQQMARQAQVKIRHQQLIQLALKDLRLALENQYTLAKNLEESNELVRESRLLVLNETKKLKAGFSTLFFLIDFELRLTSALTQQANIYKQYFQNIARIRFLSSAFFFHTECLDTITVENLISLDRKSLF